MTTVMTKGWSPSTRKSIGEAEAVLRHFDKNNNGLLERAEVVEMMQVLNDGKEPTEEDITFVYAQLDKASGRETTIKDGDAIEAHDAVDMAALWNSMIRDQEEISMVFSKFDPGATGKLDAAQLASFLRSLNGGVAPAEDEVSFVLKKVDVNENNAVDKQELLPAVEAWYLLLAFPYGVPTTGTVPTEAKKSKRLSSSTCVLM